jgi:hypothetical protein
VPQCTAIGKDANVIKPPGPTHALQVNLRQDRRQPQPAARSGNLTWTDGSGGFASASAQLTCQACSGSGPSTRGVGNTRQLGVHLPGGRNQDFRGQFTRRYWVSPLGKWYARRDMNAAGACSPGDLPPG